NDDDQREVLQSCFCAKYNVDARDLQIESVLSLMRQRDTFLLASTGYGKSRTPELYLLMYPKGSRAIVLVLNPLDALGD
ncbi:hypothetical protein CROQUDRAFT_15131, partial [Cronartium quercuum f. sp. fusiforme G11]